MTPFVKFLLSAVCIFIFAFMGTVLFFMLPRVPKVNLASFFPKTSAVVKNTIAAPTLAATDAANSEPSSTQTAPMTTTQAPISTQPHSYIEVINSCGPHYEGACVNARSGPSTTSPAVQKLRDGIVLAVATDTLQDADGNQWYKIIFDEWIRYPERVSSDRYVEADNARFFQKPLESSIEPGATTTTQKNILVDRTTQMLYAYDGTTLFLKSPVSTGLELTPTPRGTFTIYRKSPSRYMQGPLPGVSDQYYDLPGVPWDLYFTAEGGAIHGAYWHNEFGQPWSHGCVNLPLDAAQKLYDWADVGTVVTVRD
jgi:lipoprotein-anchoring transpeptidase ErfK/SrfK